MSGRAGTGSAPSAGFRRARYGLSTLVLLVAATGSCLIAGALGAHHHARWDVTATREHTLSARTIAMLARLTEPHQIVVCAETAVLDRPAAGRMKDLLAELARNCPNLRSTWIDTGSAGGQSEFARLIADLAAARRPELDEQRAALSAAARSAESFPSAIAAVSDAIKAVAGTLPVDDPRRSDLDRQAGLVRTFAPRAELLPGAISRAARNTVAGATLPAPDAALDQASPLASELGRVTGAVADFAGALRASKPGPRVEEAADRLFTVSSALRDDAARLADGLARLKPLEPLIVARVLEAGPAVLLSGPSGVLAIDFQSLFPTGLLRDPEAPNAEPPFSGEQLIATALSTLNDPLRPIVVLVHAESVRLVEETGGPTPVARRAFRGMFDRLRLARVDAAEWPVAEQPLRPTLDARDGERPVVWLIFPPPSRAGVDPRKPEQLADRNQRVARLAGAVKTLLDAGQNFLLCTDPSDLPAIGEPDQSVAPLESLGIKVDTSRTLVRRDSSPAGPLTSTFAIVRADNPGHPIAQAIQGLAAALTWPSPIALASAPPPGCRLWPLLEVPAGPAVWAESQWLAFRDMTARGLARPLEPVLLTDPPSPQAGRDSLAPEAPSRAWVIAAAAERDRSPGAPAPGSPRQAGPQRVVIVASPTWLDDAAMLAADVVSGRRALLYPANAELLEASIFWLAGMDDLIAPGPTARDVPRIRMIDERAISALRWALIAGLPTLVLLLGVILRVARG